MCEFCKKFDFGSASCNVDRFGATIVLAGGSYRYPEHEQFRLCPNCGTSIEKIREYRKMKENQ